MVLERIDLMNFQNHRRKTIRLSPTVTCLVGDNEAGKSAIWRALRWVCLNEPLGSWMIRFGEKEAKARLWVDGHKVTRAKGVDNLYQLDKKQSLKAFAATVPDEIARLVNVSDLNFQSQVAQPFWFAESAGKISRELNAVVALDIIDIALANAANAVKRASVAVDLAATRVSDSAKASEALDWVSGASRAFTSASDAQARSCELSIEVDELANILEQIDTLAKDEQSLARLVELNTEFEREQALTVQVNQLDSMIERLAGLDRADDKVVLLERLMAELKASRAASDEHAELFALVMNIHKQEEVECQNLASHTAMKERLKSETRGRCPLCGAESFS